MLFRSTREATAVRSPHTTVKSSPCLPQPMQRKPTQSNKATKTPFRMDWLDLLAVQGTLKNLLQHHSSKASILWCSAFFTVQLSHPYMTTGKTIALTRWTFVGKVMSLLLNMLSRLVHKFNVGSDYTSMTLYFVKLGYWQLP